MNTTSLHHAVQFLVSWLDYRFAQTTLPGLSVAVSHKGGIVFSRQYGLADTERQTPVTSGHLFGVASQTKMFVTVAVMQLVEEGRLRLDQPACHYLPWLAVHSDTRVKEITVRQLLAHSAGLFRDLPEADFWIFAQAFPDEAALHSLLLHAPLAIEPNTVLKYSNTSYALLGEIIAKVSDQPYEAYIIERIIQKLKLPSTHTDYIPAISADVVTGYSVPHNNRRVPIRPRQPLRALMPVAGLHSTADDMCRFASALCIGDMSLISDASKKEVLRSQWVQADGYDAGTAFGLGFEIMSLNDRRLAGHSGHLAGHVSATYVDPYSHLVVSVMANSKDAPSPQIALGIFEILDFFAEHGAEAVPAARQRFNARLLSPLAAVEIVATASAIVAIDPNDWRPFSAYEELTLADTDILQITTSGSVFNHGEYVRYHFSKRTLQSVVYAGNSLLPEALYQQQPAAPAH